MKFSSAQLFFQKRVNCIYDRQLPIMGLPLEFGYLTFVLVPVSLWLIGALAVKRRPVMARLCAFVAGSDNRLSLSRIQAFAWTLVIFGSFAGAMICHTRIASGTDAEVSRRTIEAKRVFDNAEADLKVLDSHVEVAKKKDDEKKAAETEATTNSSISMPLLSSTDPEKVKKAQAEAQKAKDAVDERTSADQVYKAAVDEREKKSKQKDEAAGALDITSSSWVTIPAGLLSLAGIAIGSGVFSSLISAVDTDSKTACITHLSVPDRVTVDDRYKGVNLPPSAVPFLIEGQNLGTAGRVRIGKRSAPILYWSNEGNAVIVDALDEKGDRVVVETANGKLSYGFSGGTQSPRLDLPEFVYDLADLFRDDKNPTTFSLMKFQMFGWTAVAIAAYIWLFLLNLSPHLSELPKVDSSIVLLTGLSQTGYLVGKAVSGVSNPAQA